MENRSLTLFSDSQAAIDSLKRGGVGRIKHVALRVLFLSSLIKNKLIEVKKVAGEVNVSDILTKHVPRNVLHKLLSLLALNTSWSLDVSEKGVREEDSFVNE